MPKHPRRIRRKSSQTYHHGDLKAALVAAAGAILREDGPSALTLRAVASATGVTATATYRHFADRRGLIAAVAEAGFRTLQEELLVGIRAAPERLGLQALARSYVRFAHQHAAEYRVMFGPEVADASDLPSLRQTAREVLDFVNRGIAQLQAAGQVRDGDPGRMAAVTWASLHGLVMLSLDGQTHGIGGSLDDLVEEMTRVMMFGLAPRPSP